MISENTDMNSKKYQPPTKTIGDAAHTIARASVGTIPIAGAAASELLNTILTPPIEKRRCEWPEKDCGQSDYR